MKIKICGMRDAENIRRVAALQPDYMGFIFYLESPRYIGKSGVKKAPDGVKKVGVFVDESLENILKQIADYELYAVQLHGSESVELCAALQAHTKVIKAFGVDEHFDFSLTDAYHGSVDFLLFDTKSAVHGGSGRTFNWRVLDRYEGSTPFFLSGGIGPENIKEAAAIRHPAFYALDLNSRFEISPGLKDVEKLKKALVEIGHFTQQDIQGAGELVSRDK
ncbi:MAG: phosphoribosylanthranilate isomerase [Mucilaginibacter polytrichastri]|nr:phosphoribosylanthranilate isomerase [Mucilaginibacter polytrichastri]